MDERSERIARRFDLPMLVAALLVVPVVAVEQSNLGDPWRLAASVLNWTIWLAFVSEVVVMLAVVPDKRRWVRRSGFVYVAFITGAYSRMIVGWQASR